MKKAIIVEGNYFVIERHVEHAAESVIASFCFRVDSATFANAMSEDEREYQYVIVGRFGTHCATFYRGIQFNAGSALLTVGGSVIIDKNVTQHTGA